MSQTFAEYSAALCRAGWSVQLPFSWRAESDVLAASRRKCRSCGRQGLSVWWFASRDGDTMRLRACKACDWLEPQAEKQGG